MLSDEQSTVIRAFGILNEQVPKNSAFFGVPHPVTFLVDANGIVQSRHFEEDYRTRYTVGSILARNGMPMPGRSTSLAAKHLALRTSASDEVVRGGERIQLVLQVDLPKKTHVYAPGVAGYIPIEWKIDDSPAYTAAPVTYPPSRNLHLKAIKETVPVYEGTVRIQREIVVAQKNAPGPLTIQGTFRYQACDDRKCYLPETVPVVWTLRFEPHDSTRAPEALRRQAPSAR